MQSRYNTHNAATVITTLTGGSYRNIPFANTQLKVLEFDKHTKVAKCYDTVANIKAAFPGAWPKAYAAAPDTDYKRITVKAATVK